ncbi:MAG: hypothetical protein ACUVXA_04470 [Candidatus Jordarchaeum sp.]|uniref:hypothetical protein n=1 Tax=Candidatus Jordarchaeum sp. TaxID=2823881 RepID=UPI00404A6849
MKRKQLIEKLMDDVERNKGKWNSKGIAIINIENSIIGIRGKVSEECIEHYLKFPISEMHEGDSIHNGNSFLMRVTEKTAVIVVLGEEHFARLSAINLRGRISALHDFYLLDLDEKQSEKILEKGTPKESSSILGDTLNKIKSGEIAADIAINEWLNSFINKVRNKTEPEHLEA